MYIKQNIGIGTYMNGMVLEKLSAFIETWYARYRKRDFSFKCFTCHNMTSKIVLKRHVMTFYDIDYYIILLLFSITTTKIGFSIYSVLLFIFYIFFCCCCCKSRVVVEM